VILLCRQEATDAMALRSRINECFELAALPHTTAEQRRKLLTFCVVRAL
jgi:NADH dehydrogenase FAD-containing subunit